MKRILLSLISVAALSLSVSAQSLSSQNATLVVPGTTADWTLVANIDIMNISNNTVDVSCHRTVNNLAPGQTSSFCWGTNCYGDSTTLSTTPVTLTAGGSTNSFIGDLHVNASAGTSNVSYAFFNQANPGDETTVTFQYVVTVAQGIDDLNAKPVMNAPQPNPSDKFATIPYTLKSNPGHFTVDLYNITGSRISSYTLSSKAGVLIIPTEELQSGIYFYALKQNDKPIVTQKLIVSHK